MKIKISVLIAFLILLNSCKSDGEETAIAPGDDLSVIKQKLELLETDFIYNSSNDLNAKFNPKKAKSLNKSNEDCQHEFIFQEEDEGEEITITQRLFDGNDNAITDCELENLAQSNSINYAVEQNFLITGENYEMDYDQYTRYSASLKMGLTSATYSESINSDLVVYLQLAETIFNFLEGSYVNMNRSFSASSDNEFETLYEETEPNIEIKYILGLDANGNNYHFDLILDQDDLNKSKIENKYNLSNDSNKKVGVVKYTLYSTGTERFDVYDLDGNIVD